MDGSHWAHRFAIYRLALLVGISLLPAVPARVCAAGAGVGVGASVGGGHIGAAAGAWLRWRLGRGVSRGYRSWCRALGRRHWIGGRCICQWPGVCGRFREHGIGRSKRRRQWSKRRCQCQARRASPMEAHSAMPRPGRILDRGVFSMTPRSEPRLETTRPRRIPTCAADIRDPTRTSDGVMIPIA